MMAYKIEIIPPFYTDNAALLMVQALILTAGFIKTDIIILHDYIVYLVCFKRSRQEIQKIGQLTIVSISRNAIKFLSLKLICSLPLPDCGITTRLGLNTMTLLYMPRETSIFPG